MNGECRQCKSCYRDFMPKYEWQTQCLPCFLASPKGKEWKERQQGQRNGFNHEWQEDNFFEQEKERFKRAYDGKFRTPHNDELPSSGLSKELLRKIIMLCHPDKHGGSTMSNEVTKELLAMKERMK